MNDEPIGIFDSGVGGLTVVREIIDHLPNEHVIYLGDTARFPYGPREANQLRSFVFEIIEFLMERGVKFIVIACNSSSAAALRSAQECFDIPIVGVIEPGARAAVQVTKNRRIGVIGTQATIESRAYSQAIRSFDAGAKVYSKVCAPFADLVEKGEVDSLEARRTVEEYLKPLIEARVDTLILGCTHYPLLSKVIAEVIGGEVELISSAKEVATEVEEILSRRGHLRQDGPAEYSFISTGDAGKFLESGKGFLGSEIEEVEQISLAELGKERE